MPRMPTQTIQGRMNEETGEPNRPITTATGRMTKKRRGMYQSALSDRKLGGQVKAGQ